METGELITVLRDAGLSPYQDNAYVTLLELGSASASNLATVSSVPGPRIYDVLRALEDDGYVVTYQQDQLYARANDPAEALAEIRTRVGRFEAAINEVETRWRQPEAHEHEITVIRRFETVFEQTKQNILDAEYYVLLSATPAQFRDLRSALREVHERGVYTHVIIHPQPGEDTRLQADDFEGVCTEARRTVPCWGEPFAALVDHQKLSFALYLDTPDEYGILVDDPLHEFVFWFYLAGLSEIAEPVYTAPETQMPIVFGEIRDCIRTVEPLLQEETAVLVQVRGHRTTTRRSCTLSGRVVGVEYAGEPQTDGPASLFHLIEQATLVVETDDDRLKIGGHGASLEDIEAERIIVEEIGPD